MLCPRPVLTFPISSAQNEFRQAGTWIRGFVGGRGSGKTVIGAIDQILDAKANDSRMIIAPTYGMIDDATFPTFVEVAKKLDVWIKETKTPLRRAYCRTRDGGVAEFVFRSGENPDSLRGPSKTGVWLDEASIMHHDVFNVVVACLRPRLDGSGANATMGLLTMTFTPKGKRHWTFDTFFQPAADGTAIPKSHTHLAHSQSRDNPFLPADFVDKVSSQYSHSLAEQELAGEFVDFGGLMFQTHWFETVTAAPAEAPRVRYWDKAATAGGGCYSAGVLLARAANGVYYVENMVRGRWSYWQRDRIMLETARRDADRHQNRVLIFFEQEPGSGGKESAMQTIKLLAGFSVYRDVVSGSGRERSGRAVPGRAKITRAGPFAAQAEAGNVKIVRADWNDDWLDEICAFPESTHTDQVDATSGAVNKLAERTGLSGEQPVCVRDSKDDPARFGIHVLRHPTAGRYRRGR